MTVRSSPESAGLRLIFLLALVAPAAAQAVQLQPPKILGYPPPSQPLATALGDVDGDGQLDLALLGNAPATLWVVRNQAGAFSAGPIVHLPVAVDRGDVAAADLDGDGDVDFATCVAQAGLVYLVENTGSGLALVGAPLAVGLVPVSLAAGDLDGDGDFDLAVGNESSAFASLLRNDGGFAFEAVNLRTTSSAGAIALGDLDADGDLDLAALDTTARELHTWLQQGGQLKAQGPLAVAHAHVGLFDLEAGDLDGDTDEDLILSGTTQQGINTIVVQVVSALGAGQLQVGPLMGLNSGGGGAATLGDLDGDGRLDLSISNVLGLHVAVHLNPGNGSFGGTLPTVLPMAFGAADLVAADLDGNGAADLVTCDPVGHQVRLYFNLKSGTPCDVRVYCTPKTTSLGTQPSIQACGVPSFGAQGFALRLSAAVPGSLAIGIRGEQGPASLPFAGGTLCVQPPLVRLAPRKLSPWGSASQPLPIASSSIGSTRWYQWWFRDPAHPDGTGAGLSDGLAVTYCP